MQLCALETHIRNEKSQVWPRTLSMPPFRPKKAAQKSQEFSLWVAMALRDSCKTG